MKELKKYELNLDEITWHIVTKDRAAQNGVKDTMEWLATNDHPFNSGVVSGLITHCCNQNQIENAKKIFKKAKKEQVDLKSSIFLPFIQYYLRIDEPEKAMRFLNKMKSKNIKPNIKIFNTFLSYYGSKNDYKKGYEIIQNLKEENIKILPYTRNLIGNMKEGIKKQIDEFF